MIPELAAPAEPDEDKAVGEAAVSGEAEVEAESTETAASEAVIASRASPRSLTSIVQDEQLL